MFSHGRAQNVAALVSATILVFFMSLETFREAIPKFSQAEAGEFQDINLALIVILIGMFVAGAIAMDGIYLFKDNVHYLVGRAP